jgi:hypothetical protein
MHVVETDRGPIVRFSEENGKRLAGSSHTGVVILPLPPRGFLLEVAVREPGSLRTCIYDS